MRKSILTLAVVMIMVVAVGCSSKGTTIESNMQNSACMQGAPEWVVAGGADTGLSAIGSAVIGKAGLQYARTEALAGGRDEIARILSLKVNNMIKNFTQVTGMKQDESVDKVSANVSKQVSSQMVGGSKQIGSWVSSCDELYILVGVDATLAQTAVKEQTISSFRNDNALWQQFQAMKAQDELDASIQTEFRSNK